MPVDSAKVTDVSSAFVARPLPAGARLRRRLVRDRARLEEHRSVLPGLVIQAEPKRLYPGGKAVAHLVGYVSEVTEADLSARPLSRERGWARSWAAGLEREYDDTLRGAKACATSR